MIFTSKLRLPSVNNVSKNDIVKFTLALLILPLLGCSPKTDSNSLASGGLKPEPVFSDISAIKQQISAIFSAKKSKISSMIRLLRPTINADKSDEQLFLTKNCSPATIALQKILADEGIYAEARVNNNYAPDHEYLLYRAPMKTGHPLEVVIDPTYRQFLFNYANRQLFKNYQGGTIDDATVFSALIAYDLDEVMITEYAKLDDTLLELSAKLPEFDSRYEMRFAYEKGPLDRSKQKEHGEFLSADELKRIQKGTAH